MGAAWIFNDWQTWEACRENSAGPRPGTLYTDHPYLYEKLQGEGFNVIAPAELIDRARENSLAHFVSGLIKRWQEELNALPEGVSGPVRVGTALGRPFFSLVNSAVFRAAQFEKILERHDEVKIPYLSGDARNRPEAVVKALNFFNCNYYALLAASARGRGGFSRVGLVELKSSAEEVSRRRNARPMPLSRGRYWQLLALRILAQDDRFFSPAVAALFSSVPLARRRGRIWIYLDSIFLERTLPALARRGYVAKKWVLPAAEGVSDDAPADASEIEKILIGAYEALGGSHGRSECLDLAVRAAAMRTALYVVRKFIPAIGGLCRCVDAWRRKVGSGRDVIFTNSLCEPEEAALEHVAKSRGVPLIAFEHGVKGLTSVDDTVGAFSDLELCSGYVAQSPYEIEFYRDADGVADKPVFVSGIADLTAPRSFKLSRWLGRRFLGEPVGRKLVLYAPTRFREDNVWIGCETGDVAYWRFIKELIFSVFSSCDADVFIKLHQKGWLPGQKAVYDMRKHPIEIAPLPGNVRYGTFPQLNYIRWAADAIVIDRATSTIQWALTHEIPLIYVDLPANPLTERIRGIMSDSVFVVDAKAGGWRDEMTELLNLPAKELKSRWEEKKSARERFLAHCVWGPDFNGAAFARWVGNFTGHAETCA